MSYFNKLGPAPPFAWYGGKANLAEWICGFIPPHLKYVEPYAGMANVFFKKFESEIEILNDQDSRIVNFFQVIRDREALQELERLAFLTPHARAQFEGLIELPVPKSPIEAAWHFFVIARQSRGGLAGRPTASGFAAAGSRSRRRMPEPISKYLSAIDGLADVANRLRHAVIECKPAVDVIRDNDGASTFFYLDPPYLPETRSGGKAASYAFEMDHEGHVELLRTIRDCEGQVLLSGYPSSLYDQELATWTRESRSTRVQHSNSGASREEVLWRNY